MWVDPNPENIMAITLYDRLEFVRKPMPDYLIDDEGTAAIYVKPGKKWISLERIAVFDSPFKRQFIGSFL